MWHACDLLMRQTWLLSVSALYLLSEVYLILHLSMYPSAVAKTAMAPEKCLLRW